jgi:MFS family permease
MSENSLQRRSQNPWWVVLAGFSAQMITAGIGFFVFPVFLESIQTDFDWSLTKISSAFTVWGVSGAIFSPIIGKWIDRVGARKVMLAGTLMQSALTFSMAYVEHISHLYIIMAFYAIASICNTYIPVAFLVTQWFVKHRGTATGIAMLGLGAGGAIMPQLASELLGAYGWRSAYMVLSAVTLLAFIPILLWVRAPRLGEAEVEPEMTLEDHQVADITLESALKTRSFWGICLGDAIAGLVFAIFNAHLVFYLTQTLGSEKPATDVYSVLQLSLIGGTVLFGIVADRFSVPRMMIFCYTAPALATCILFVPHTLPIALLFALCCGIPVGGRQALFPVALGYSFGPTHLAAIYGLSNSFFLIGNAAGPLLAGAIYEEAGDSSKAVYATAVGLFLLSGILTTLMRREVGKNHVK